MTDHDDLIAANRTRRERLSRRRTLIIVGTVSVYLATVIIDRILGFARDSGAAPFMSAVVGCTQLGLLWADARRDEGVERVMLVRAAITALALMVLFAVGAYAWWLIASSAPGPRVYLSVAGISLMVGAATSSIGISIDEA